MVDQFIDLGVGHARLAFERLEQRIDMLAWNVARDENDLAAVIVARPLVEPNHRMEDVLNAMQHRRQAQESSERSESSESSGVAE